MSSNAAKDVTERSACTLLGFFMVEFLVGYIFFTRGRDSLCTTITTVQSRLSSNYLDSLKEVPLVSRGSRKTKNLFDLMVHYCSLVLFL
jgi:hypothetical protein